MRSHISGSRWRLVIGVVLAAIVGAAVIAYSQSWHGIYPTPNCKGCEPPSAPPQR
jgi:hypothetical protein